MVAGEASAFSQDGKDEGQCWQKDTELEEVSTVGLEPWVSCLGLLVKGATPAAEKRLSLLLRH